MQVKKEDVQKKMDELRFTALRSKNYELLLQNPAWQEMTEQWVTLIQMHDRDKMSQAYSEFLLPKVQDPLHTGQSITGVELLQQKALEEIKLDVYRTILQWVDGAIKVGRECEEKLNKYEAAVQQ